METKLTVRMQRHLIENAKRYAQKHNTTLTQLIATYLQQIPAESDELDNAPIVRRLTGTLSGKVTIEEYKKHLEDKYGRR